MDAPRPIRLPVAGLTRLTTLDFPGHLAAVVFLQGCPLACGYCHNPQMLAPRRADVAEWAEVRAFLERRRGLLEGVVFSGGEPTLHADLALAMRDVKALGFKVGLHTAGVYPRRLRALLPWLDWVGLDAKGLAEDFDRIVGRTGLAEAHEQSLALLLDSNVALECRTTVHPRDFDMARLERLIRWLASRGVPRYVLQPARHTQCLSPAYRQPADGTLDAERLSALVKRLRPLFTQLALRTE